MFTTLTVCKKDRQNLAEKLHLVKKRKFISEQINYKETEFYATRLLTYCNENQTAINSFSKKIEVPLISGTDEIVFKYIFIALSNTAFKFTKTVSSVGIFDPKAQLTFLLPYIQSLCQSVCVCTENINPYTQPCKQLLKRSGTPYMLTKNIEAMNNCQIIFTNSNIPVHSSGIVFSNTDCGFSPHSLALPEPLKTILPEYCDPICACAGLYFSGADQSLGKLYFNKVKTNGRIIDSKTLKNGI